MEAQTWLISHTRIALTYGAVVRRRAAIHSPVRWMAAILPFALVVGVTAQDISNDVIVHRSTATGLASFVTGVDGRAISVEPAPGRQRVEPIDFLRRYGRLFGVEDPETQLALSKTRTDSIGQSHTTYQQVHHGIPVFSGVLKVHQRADGNVTAANGDVYPIPGNLRVIPTITADEAVDTAFVRLTEVYGDIALPAARRAALVIVDPGWYGDPSIGPRLAYHVILSEPGLWLREAFFVDAHRGEVLDQWSLVHRARNRLVYSAFGAPALPGMLVRSEGGPATGVYDIDAAYDYLGDSYDYFFRAFGRDGIDDAGMDLVAVTEWSDSTCPNAYWDEAWALFCVGMAGDDVVAHELTHGVTQRTADLIYQNQPGQLNESFSDVFGELVDLFNGDAAFAGAPGGAPWPAHETGPGTDIPNDPRGTSCDGEGVRWKVGEDAVALVGPVRDMWNPPCFDDPDCAGSALYACPGYDFGGVHSGSGIPNHAFAIVTDGKTFNGHTVEPIGPIKAGAIWNRALTTYLTPASDFEDAFYALVQAGADLIGTTPNDPRTGGPSDSPITAHDVVQVIEALRAVEMDTPGQCGAGDRVLAPDPAFRCPSRTTIYADDFERGAPGWTVSNSGPPTPYDWVLTPGLLPFGRPGVAWFCEDRPIGDCDEQDESAVHGLQSPPIMLPIDVGPLHLSFTHYIRTEGGWDGGNLQFRVNAGPWWTVPRTFFQHSPYNARLNTDIPQGNTNPLAGEPGWTGVGGHWGTSVVDLTGLAGGGDTLELQFAFGKNGCTGLTGWYVDDVEVYTCPDCDADGIPDYDKYRFTYSFPPVGNIGSGSPQTLVLSSPPPAGSDITLSLTAVGDFSHESEVIWVNLGGYRIGTAFEFNASDCGLTPESDELTMDAYTYNLLTRNGLAVFTLKASGSVHPDMCNGASFVTLSISYYVTATPAPEPDGVIKSRYLSFVPGNAGRRTALRVTLADLPPPFDARHGEVRWVGRPFDVSELPGVTSPTPPVFHAAGLTCEPLLMDWGAVGTLHVSGEEIVPGAVYQVHAFEEACGRALGEGDVPPLTVATAGWADVTEPYAVPGGPPQPDLVDVIAVIDKFKSLSGAPIKARVDLYPSRPDHIIDILDATFAMDAFKGIPYPFAGPRPCP